MSPLGDAVGTVAIVEIYRRKLRRDDFLRMNLPEDFWRAKVQYVQPSAIKPVTNYLLKIDRMMALGAGLWLTGGPGVGKTSIAALAAKEARSRGYTVYFTSVWELRECARSRIGFDDRLSVMGRCQEVDLLILDELRVEDRDQAFLGAKELQDLISFRRAHSRPTIITTRLKAKELAIQFSGLCSAGDGCMVVIPVEGKNLRSDREAEIKSILGIESK